MTTLLRNRINEYAVKYEWHMSRMTNEKLVANYGHSVEFWAAVRKVVDAKQASIQAGAWHTGYMSK